MPALVGTGLALAPAPYGLPVYTGGKVATQRVSTALLVGKRNAQPRGFATGNTSCTYRVKHPVAVSATNLQLRFPAWTTQAAGTGDTPTGNTVTLGAVYVEYLGALYPVTFDGASSRDIASGDEALSDPVAGLTVTTGNTLYVRTYVTVASGGQWPTLYGAVAYPDEVSRPGANLANATGDLTGTGQSVSNLYGPMQIVGTPVAGQPTYAVEIFGDSIVAGVNDSFSDESQTGYWQRALYPGTRPFSFVALPGESAVQVLTSQGAKRAGIIGEGATYFVNEYGINDLQGGATLAQLQARVLSVAGLANDATVVKKYQQTLGPKSSSTDAWATTTNQTTDGINTTRTQFNDWVRDGMPISNGLAVATGTSGATRTGDPAHPYQGYLEVADLCETARNSGIWKAGYTNDGLHPGPTGNASIAAALSTATWFPDTGAAPGGGTGGGGSSGSSGLTRVASASPTIRSSAYLGAAATQDWASNSFSPPVSSLIVVIGQATESYNNAWNSAQITDSLGTHLSWTRIDQQADVSFAGVDTSLAVFAALCPTAQTGMTATVTQSLAGSGQTITFASVDVHVFTGHDTTTPVASLVKGILTSTALAVAATPGGTAGSFLLLAANNAAAASSATAAGSGEYLASETHTGTSYATAWYGASTGPTLTTAPQTLDLTGNSGARWQYVAIEIRGAASATGAAYTPTPAEQLGLTDAAAAAVDAARAGTDAVGLADAASTAVDGARAAADPLSLTDAASTALDAARASADAVALTETTAASVDANRSTADGLGIADAASLVVDAARAAADPLGLSDSITAVIGAGATLSDTIGVADSVIAAVDTVRAAADGVGLADSVTSRTDVARPADDAVGLADAVVLDAGHAAADAESLVDQVTILVEAARATDDGVGLTDAATLDAGRSSSDQVSLGDQASTVLATARATPDPLGLTDSVTISLSGASGQTAGDQLGLTDTVAAAADRTRATSDELGLTDSALAELDRGAAADDALTLTDQATSTLGVQRTADDALGLADVVTVSLTTSAGPTPADPLGLSDSVLIVMTRTVIITDRLGLTDTASSSTTRDDGQHDHTFAGHLDQRAWSGHLEPRSWEGALT